MPKSFIDISGQKFNRLTALKRIGASKTRHSIWLCRCECGRLREVLAIYLRNGHTKSCGCLLEEWYANGNIKHGHAGRFRRKTTAEYRSWSAMLSRCYNENMMYYGYYGGCGIKVCKRWRSSFSNFLKDMGLKPSPKHTIDRYPNPYGDYKPSNCRWATRLQQRHNRRQRHA